MPPFLIKPLLGLLLAVLMGLGLRTLKARYDNALEEAQTAKAQVVQLEGELKNAKGVEKLTIRYVDRIKTIEGVTRVITKEIPKLVTVQADARCIVPVGFVSVFNASATNTVPATPADPDAPAAGIELSDVATAITENHDLYHKTATQLEDLQTWVKEKLNENPPAGY